MAKTTETTETLLDLAVVTQPFDLATAIGYMKANSEFIRCKTTDKDFYMYLDVQKRPAIVNGRRKFVDITTIQGFDQWGGAVNSISLADLVGESFYIMAFDETGSPNWSDPSQADS